VYGIRVKKKSKRVLCPYEDKPSGGQREERERERKLIIGEVYKITLQNQETPFVIIFPTALPFQRK
jgi:hypothetical protein